ncbi:hypothetical protein [Neoroseomonas soli]|uniref:Uncharacterized protein n=1 Tax=Neoroseomonas soli TaxID=1081025 RepID=A0A9X9WTF6_9PROT|nr:hypothetical protein [Neoroseomonas soli]MBR0670435.1 hypothetical protein [Neoroseomonas soli]
MDDKDHVFARFKDNKPAASDRRELLTIPRRAGAPGSRVVEVVHVRSGAAIKNGPRRIETHVRAASWDAGLPARQTAQAVMPTEPVVAEATQPITHLMPAWAPASVEAEGAPLVHSEDPSAATVQAAAPRSPKARNSARRVADPFNADDDGANCMRCGYAVEPARERRGLLTCASCG